MEPHPRLHPWLQFDTEEAVASLSERLREAVHREQRRRGAVVAMSGGIDSSVCAALAACALSPERVLGLALPERDSSPVSLELAEHVARHLGVPFVTEDLSAALDAVGCYRRRDEAFRSVFPEYGERWKSKIVAAGRKSETDRFTWFKLVVEAPGGKRMEKRLPLEEYLQIVAATNFKQRLRKTMEYYHADRLHYAVVGTPNRLEYDQGFFVKNGDGSADIKPIAHLYKSQVYELGRHLGLPEKILTARPTTDTYSLEQGQDEFYFIVPYTIMDLILVGMNHGRSVEEIATETQLGVDRVRLVMQDIRDKRRTTRPLHLKPVLLEPIPEVDLSAGPYARH
jgi:NAD+ synthase